MPDIIEKPAKIGDFPDTTWAIEVCKVGQGHDCCRYLTMAPDGWSCEKKGRLRRYLDVRAETCTMTARADNCPGKDAR